MTRIAEALGVSRSIFYYEASFRRTKKSVNEFKEYVKQTVFEVCEIRSTYGYPRVTALVNRINKNKGLPRVNHKRIYKIMKENHLLLQRHAPRPKRTHEGKIIALRSNIRWCSDILGIRCWDGRLVWVAFVMDCHDREIINYVGSTIGIDGEMIRDMVFEAKEQRFGDSKAPSTQFLSDNGPQYTALATVNFLESLGFEVCNTPAYSPESNGMAEAFVKTFKRDYTYVNSLDSAEEVLQKLHNWVDDYNKFAPHKGLNMMSPKEFIESELALVV
ncbi:integrase core domain protein [Leptospira fainei serovar Hurstbridge str. BUT 6]|uniref:Integrase core domain protein n=2 Tax=Leptospira fainei TaxID=48782 RepID=S3UW91_9LEPT|nr:integrase core domain protein [Leptospira fainei serovar Hurstbridge str. BUT 6]